MNLDLIQRLRRGALLALPVVLALGAIGPAGGQPATPMPDGEQEDYGCVSYRTGPEFNRNLYGTCTQSTAWWESFSCKQTPIQNGPWVPPNDRPGAASPFKYNPWLHLETDGGDVVVMLWFGSRPIPAGNYAETLRGVADVSIIFPTSVSSVSLAASEPTVTDALELQPRPSTFVTDGTVWDADEINPPKAGCWTYSIIATTEGGTEIRAPFTFVAVE